MNVLVFLTLDIVIAALLVCIFLLEKEHARERKDMYNRLMSKDYPEYNVFESTKKSGKKRSNNPFKDSIDNAYLQQGQNSPE